MREALQKPRTLYFLAFGVLVAMVISCCSQNEGVGGGDQTFESRTSADLTSGDGTAVTKGTTTQEETTTQQQTPTGKSPVVRRTARSKIGAADR